MKAGRGWWLAVAVTACAIGILPVIGYADDFNKGSRSHEKGKIDKSRMEDRGQPGANEGGQMRPPGEGEQSGRPGTSFGAPATLPPSDKSPGFEGAGERQKKAPTAGGPN